MERKSAPCGGEPEKTTRATIVIPAFNEARRIGNVLNSLRDTRHEVIVVDDGSSDRTCSVVESMGFTCHRLEQNQGKGHACRHGVGKASHDHIVIMDADDQFDVGDIPRLLKALDGCDMVIGRRDMGSVPLPRRLSNWFAAGAISSIAGQNHRDVLCGFRAFRKGAFMELGTEKPSYEFESEVTIKAAKKGLRIRSVPVKVRYFSDGNSMGLGHSARLSCYILKEFIKSKVGR